MEKKFFPDSRGSLTFDLKLRCHCACGAHYAVLIRQSLEQQILAVYLTAYGRLHRLYTILLEPALSSLHHA